MESQELFGASSERQNESAPQTVPLEDADENVEHVVGDEDDVRSVADDEYEEEEFDDEDELLDVAQQSLRALQTELRAVHGIDEMKRICAPGH